MVTNIGGLGQEESSGAEINPAIRGGSVCLSSQAIEDCNRAHITVRMVTGDNIGTAKARPSAKTAPRSMQRALLNAVGEITPRYHAATRT